MFVDTKISEVLRAAPFSQYQALKSSGDWCIRILKNIVINF
jgi:hypothetical protein